MRYTQDYIMTAAKLDHNVSIKGYRDFEYSKDAFESLDMLSHVGDIAISDSLTRVVKYYTNEILTNRTITEKTLKTFKDIAYSLYLYNFTKMTVGTIDEIYQDVSNNKHLI